MTDCLPEEMLSAHLDGDLDEGEAARVKTHLSECAACQTTLEELGALRDGLSALGEVEPSRDLWAQISVRHNEERTGRPWFRLAVPAVAAAAAAALLIVLMPHGAPETGAEPKIARAYAGVVAAERTYIDSIAALEEAVGDEAVATMSPKARVAIELGLAQIDATIEHCKRELEAAPNDFSAHRTLLAAYQRKVDLLTELVDRNI